MLPRTESASTAAVDLRRRGWTVEGGMLLADGEAVAEVSARQGTPIYIYNLGIVARRAAKLRSAFPEWQVCYAVKANPHRAIIEQLYAAGCALEVSSEGELAAALDVAPGSEIGVVGPGKTDRLIVGALEAHVRWIAAESECELAIVLREARRIGANGTSFLLRINADGDVVGAGETMAGGASQFGIDEACASAFLARGGNAAKELSGLHLYAGSQLLQPGSAAENSAMLLKTFWRLRASATRALSILVCGLGLGVDPAITAAAATGPADVRAELDCADGVALRDIPDAVARPELDVGRYLVADAGVLVMRVLDVKRSHGRTFVVADGGMRSFARPILSWAETHGVSVVGKADAQDGERVTVVGPACLPGDVIARDIVLPHLSRDDLLLVHSTGAYGLTMSPTRWGSFGETREISVAA